MSDLELGRSPRCGPKAGSRAKLCHSIPTAVYPLPNGFNEGDAVTLIDFNGAYWEVRRDADGRTCRVFSSNICDAVEPPPTPAPPRGAAKPNWPAIIAVAQRTGEALSGCSKPGQTVRRLYWTSYSEARRLGYPGSEDDWPIFVKRRG
jgi:hypothetical protein